MSGGILALDIATQLGFALERPGQRPIHGSVNLRSVSSHPGAVYCVLADWLFPLMDLHQPERVIFESPLMIMPERDGKMGGNPKTLRRLITMPGVVEMLTCRLDIPVTEAASQTARRFFCGSGRADKEAVIAECFRRGLTPQDNNDADALCLLLYAVNLFAPQRYQHVFRESAL